MHRIIVIVLSIMFMYTNIATANIQEIETIRKEVGEKAMIVKISGCYMFYDDCSTIYIVRKDDGSIWTYYADVRIKGSKIVGRKGNVIIKKGRIIITDGNIIIRRTEVFRRLR